MTPYKDPKKQQKYGRNWATNVRREWMQKQECALCGRRMNLRIFRHAGTPRLSWSLKGPSHNKYRVVCGDPVSCLRYRKDRVQQGTQNFFEGKKRRTTGEGEVVQPSLRKRRVPSKLAEQLEKADTRPVCPVHGPKRTTILHRNGRARFVCCGRYVE